MCDMWPMIRTKIFRERWYKYAGQSTGLVFFFSSRYIKGFGLCCGETKAFCNIILLALIRTIIFFLN